MPELSARYFNNVRTVENARLSFIEQLLDEQQLRLNEVALVITSSQEIEGRIIDYHADPTDHDITIESRD